MYDQSFNKQTLRACLEKSDFKNVAHDERDEFRDEAIRTAQLVSSQGFTSPLNLQTFIRKGKPVYKLKDLADALVLRKAQENLQKILVAKPLGRDQIVRSLACLLEEGVPYRIYRKDLSAFYESMRLEQLSETLRRNTAISRNTTFLISDFLAACGQFGINGLPRGIPISAPLSEFAMRNFDESVKSQPNTFFYSRFVDDILIITDSFEEESVFHESLIQVLPSGLEFNSRKNLIQSVPRAEGDHASVLTLDYLGYQLTVLNPSKSNQKNLIRRSVQFDISENKVKKIKSRIVRSILGYTKNSDFPLFLDQIRALTGNYSIQDRKRGRIQNVGIYFNYQFVNPETSNSLKELDEFLLKAFLSNKGKAFYPLSKGLTSRQRRKLLRHRFSFGFKNRVFHHFGATRLGKIKSCWRYE